MWASSPMGPRGFRVSLARTATKEDCTEVEFSASENIPCYRRAKHGTTPPSGRKGGLPPYLDYTGVCRWTGYGFWSPSLNMVYNFMRIFPNRVGLVRSTFHFAFLNMVRVSNPQRHPTPKHWSKALLLPPPPPPRPPGSGTTLQNLQSRTF